MRKYLAISKLLFFLWMSGACISAQSLSDDLKETYTDLTFYPLFQEFIYIHFYDLILDGSQEPSAHRVDVPDITSSDLIFVDSVKFKYDNSGNVTYRERFRYRDGAWKSYARSELEYDDQSNLLVQTGESFENGNWVYTSRRLYDYDQSGNLISEVYQLANYYTGHLEERTIRTYEYDDNHNQIKFLRQRVDTGGFAVNSEKRLSTFDSQNNKKEVVVLNWSDNEWQNSWRHSFEYNNESFLTLRSMERSVNQSWEMHQVDIVEYDNQWNEPKEMRSYMFDDYGEMYPLRFLGMTYDQTGMLDTAYFGNWMEDTNDFRISQKTFLSIDEESNMFTIKTENKYNQHGFILYNNHEFDFADNGNLKFYSFSRPVFEGLKYRVEYFYDSGEELTNLREIEAESLSVFPNPATDYINLRIGEVNGPHKVYLTNTVGQKQLIAEIPNGAEEVHIDLRDVPPGLYQLNLQTQNQGSISTQLIIQK
jgi:hypothetical protein